MRTISLLFFCFVALFSQAQDLVIGGQVELSSVKSEKYDSLRNFYHGEKDKFKMIGQEFTYYNIIDYALLEKETRGEFKIPYPWKDGRIRSGRYTSSQTAKDEYLTDLKRKSGTKYKLIKYVSYDGIEGIVFSDENGDSIFYEEIPGLVNGEFICEGFKEKCRKELVGKDIKYIKESDPWKEDKVNIDNVMYCYIGLKTREGRTSLPYLSQWNVKGMGVDTTFWGDHNIHNLRNAFCRLVFVIHNDELGDYECFADYFELMQPLKYYERREKWNLIRRPKK